MRPACRRLQEKIKENVVEEIDNPYLKGGAEKAGNRKKYPP